MIFLNINHSDESINNENNEGRRENERRNKKIAFRIATYTKIKNEKKSLEGSKKEITLKLLVKAAKKTFAWLSFKIGKIFNFHRISPLPFT
jgi:hypothetical protein